MKRVLLCLGILAIWSAAEAQAPPPEPSGLERLISRAKQGAMPIAGPSISYRYQGNNVVLRQDMARVAVELAGETNRLKIRANRVMRNLPNAVLPEDTHKDYVRSRFILEWANDAPTASAFSLDAAATSALPRQSVAEQWTARAERLRAEPGVKAVWPVYIYPQTGINLFCPGEVTVKINAGATSETLAREAAALGLEIDSIDPLRRHIITLRQTDPTRGDPFALAQTLREKTDLVAWASPNLTQRYRLMSNWVPYPTIDPSQAHQGTDALYAQQWNLHNAKFPAAHEILAQTPWPHEQNDPAVLHDRWHPDNWQVWRPQTLAILDTGCEFWHEDLVLNTWHNWGEYQNESQPFDGLDNDFNGYYDDLIGWDFVENDWDPTTREPHGTACAGIACARGYNTIGIRGGAPFYAHTPLRVANDYGVFVSDGALGQALTYAGRMCTAVSCSWGGGAPSEAIHEGILYCLTFGNGGHGGVSQPQDDFWYPLRRGAGVLCFFAAGNEYDNELSYPAADPWAISVGAMLRTDIRSDYGSFSGPSARLDIAAPGGSLLGDITTTDISTSTLGYDRGKYTSRFNGTSAAAPLAAAAGYIATVANTRTFPDVWSYLEARPYLLENAPNDYFNDFVDPRRYASGEIVQAIIQGVDKVDPYYGIYDDLGFSLQYGWGRINALKIMQGVSQGLDDVYEVNGPGDDDVRYTRPKYLRPGVHKRLLARDTDYYLISLEKYSSARIVMTYPRWVWSRANRWDDRTWKSSDKDGAIRKIYGDFEDDTTSPRLKLVVWPDLDPYKPGTHEPTQRYDSEGAPRHPLPMVIGIGNASDTSRLEDIVVCNMRADPWYNSATDWDPDQSAPERPNLLEDVAYYLKVKRMPLYTDGHFAGKFSYLTGQQHFNGTRGIDKYYKPIIEYSLQFDYCPPSNWGLYNDRAYPPPDKRSVTRSPLFRYSKSALQEEHQRSIYSSDAVGVGYINIPTMDWKEHYNAMVTYNNSLGNMGLQLWESMPALAALGEGSGLDDSGEIWNFHAHRRDHFQLRTASRDTVLNDYWVGVHYSITTNTALNKPLEFTVPSTGTHKDELGYTGAAADPLAPPTVHYYPFEHFTTANKLTKRYILRLGAKEGARVTVAQQAFQIPVYMYAWDERGRDFAWELTVGADLWTGTRTESITFEPQWRATSYTLEVGFFNYWGLLIPPGVDIRYQLAVDRYHMGMQHPLFDPLPLQEGRLGVPDLVPESFSFGPEAGITGQTTMTLNVVVRNTGTAPVENAFVRVEFLPSDGTVYGDMPTTPVGPIDLGQINPNATAERLDYPLYLGMPQGTYTARLIVDPFDIVEELDETNNEMRRTFEVQRSFYDLGVESFWMNPEQPREGNWLRIGFNARNYGTAASPDPVPFGIGVQDVGTSSGYIGSIDPGAVGTVQGALVHWIPWGLLGTRQLRIEVNPFDPAEPDQNNNTLVRQIEILPTRPDLTVFTHVVSPRRPNVGVDTRVRLTIKNVGVLQTGVTYARLRRQDGVDIGPEASVAALAVGAERTVEINLGRLPAGVYVLNAVADSRNQVLELDEDNNTRPVAFTVNVLGVQDPWQFYE